METPFRSGATRCPGGLAGVLGIIRRALGRPGGNRRLGRRGRCVGDRRAAGRGGQRCLCIGGRNGCIGRQWRIRRYGRIGWNRCVRSR
jgi:hypothetical protein